MHHYTQAHNNLPYFLSNLMQMNFVLLGNSAVPDACQHVAVTQTKEAVESVGNFHFFLDVWGPAVSLRLLCEGSTPAFPSPVCFIHRMFFLTFCIELPRPSQQACAPWIKDKFRERRHTVIICFKFNLSHHLRNYQAIICKRHLKESQVFMLFLILIQSIWE